MYCYSIRIIEYELGSQPENRMKKKNNRKTAARVQNSVLAILAMLCLAGCEERKNVVVSHEQSDLFFEITNESVLRKYESVQPKIKRYGIIEKESSFWLELADLTTTNQYVVQLRKKLEVGDFAGAEKLVDEMFVKYGTDEKRVAIRKFIESLRKTDETISALQRSITSDDLRRNSAKLREYAQDLPESGKIFAFAADKENDAAELEKLEKYRPLFWLYGDAQEERSLGNIQTAELITALIAADNDALDGARNAMVKDLMNSGMFNVPDVPVRKDHIQKEGSQENENK